MTGKARSNDELFEAYQLKQNAKFENFLAQNTNIDHGQFFTSAPPQRDLRTFLNKEFGGVMGGVIGYNPSVVTITSGVINIGRDSGKLSSHVIIQAESGTTDTLTDIQNFVFGYQDLTIQADTGDTITVSTGGTTGSDIFLGNGVTSITLNSTEQLQLRYDTIANRWATFIDTTSGGTGASQTPWLSNIDAGGFSLNNLLSADIEDSAGTSKLSISGPLGIGARFAFVTGDTVFFTENITDILSITAAGLNLLTNNITMGTGGNIVGGGSTEGMTNIGHLDFIDNTATPAASLSLYSDGTDLFANTGGIVINLSDIGGGVFLDSTFRIQGSADQTKQLAFEVDGFTTSTIRTFTMPNSDGTVFLALAVQTLDMNSNNITNTSYIESNTANRPGSGFIRMATSDEIHIRNSGNTDDIIITSGNDALGNDSVIFNVAGANQMTMSNLNLDLLQNNLKGVGNITPATSTTDVGDSGTPFLRMFSNFFIPNSATIITDQYGLAKTGNTLYVNFDNSNADAGFGIYEQGLQRFLFQQTGTTPFVTTFMIGGDPFLSGETYLIQLGEGTHNAQIKLIEGTDNDLIINRANSGVNQGVQIQTSGLSSQRWLSDQIKFFEPLNVNANDITNVVDIKSNGAGSSGTGTIGELITANGGFDYYLRDKIYWESDSDTHIQFSSAGISVVSDDALTLSSTGGTTTLSSNTLVSIVTGSSFSIIAGTTNVVSATDTGWIFQSSIPVSFLGGVNSDIDMNTNTISNMGGETINSLTADATPDDSADFVMTYDASATSLKKVLLSNLPSGGSQTPWTSDIDADGNDLDNLGFIEFNTSTLGVSTEAFIGYTGTNLRANVPTTKGFVWTVAASQVFGLGGSVVNCFQEMDMNTNKISSVVDPTLDQDAATKKYVDDNISMDGTQPFYIWEDHETDQFDFDVYMTNSMQGGHEITIFLTENQIYYTPFFISTTSNIERMGIQVEVVTSGYNLQFAVYSNRTDGQNYPETRLDVVSSINTAGTGTSTLPLTNNITLTPGLYWFAVLCNNNDTLEVSAVSEGHGNCVGYKNNGTSGFEQILSYTEAGSLNSTANDENTSVNTAPLIFAKFISV